jgi:hypothetical protein
VYHEMTWHTGEARRTLPLSHVALCLGTNDAAMKEALYGHLNARAKENTKSDIAIFFGRDSGKGIPISCCFIYVLVLRESGIDATELNRSQ